MPVRAHRRVSSGNEGGSSEGRTAPFRARKVSQGEASFSSKDNQMVSPLPSNENEDEQEGDLLQSTSTLQMVPTASELERDGTHEPPSL